MVRYFSQCFTPHAAMSINLSSIKHDCLNCVCSQCSTSFNLYYYTVISISAQSSSLTLNEGNSGEICVAVADGITERNIEIIASTEDRSATGLGKTSLLSEPVVWVQYTYVCSAQGQEYLTGFCEATVADAFGMVHGGMIKSKQLINITC